MEVINAPLFNLQCEQDKKMHRVAEHPSTFILRPSGHMNASTADAFKHQLSELLASEKHTALLLDMSAVESLDSAGLMALVAALNLAQQTGKRFGLCQVPPSIQIVFELTQLDRAFHSIDGGALNTTAASVRNA
jgi:anti-sigma B factor antagonist